MVPHNSFVKRILVYILMQNINCLEQNSRCKVTEFLHHFVPDTFITLGDLYFDRLDKYKVCCCKTLLKNLREHVCTENAGFSCTLLLHLHMMKYNCFF